MRKTVLATAFAAAFALTGCSESADDTPDATADVDTAAYGEAVQDAAEASAPLDANTATAAQLAAGNGVPADLAEAIVAGQPYASVLDFNAKLREILSEDAAAAVLSNVFVPVNLNSASREEIALIPGMTDRMVGEFLEYRPYEDMNEFNREIGKYVDEAEVARLRSYVTL